MQVRYEFFYLIIHFSNFKFFNSSQVESNFNENCITNEMTRLEFKTETCCDWFEYNFKFQSCCCKWLLGNKNTYFSPKIANGFTHGKDTVWTCYGCAYGKKC